MLPDFSRAEHTIVVSDIHLADAEPPHPKNPLWKRFKRPRYFIDSSFRDMLESLQSPARGLKGPIELVLNGDVLDFDSVMATPDPGEPLGTNLSWLERRRGLSSEEAKSRFKLSCILKDHHVWVEAVRRFIASGNRLVWVIGNHDMELHWPSVQEALLQAIARDPESRSRVRFCEWFYVSNGDTLIEHGNQYDAYSLCANPINPLIRKGQKVFVRIPFGNLAGKYMLNGMGLFNPHAESSFIRSSVKDYFVFYYKYVLQTQPFIMITWFWGAIATLLYSISEGLLPPMTDPLTVHSRVEGIAAKANASAGTIWSLRELHAHPAIYDPLKILRELWLDRAILLALILFGGFQFFSLVNIFSRGSFWWFLAPVGALMPMFVFYARSVNSEVAACEREALRAAPTAARIAGVRRTVQGHTHRELHSWISDVEYLNTGTWSPAYHDVECTQPFGRKCVAWIKPSAIPGGGRGAELLEWNGKEFLLIAPSDSPPQV